MRRAIFLVIVAFLVMLSSATGATEPGDQFRAKIEQLMELTGGKDIGKQMAAGVVQQMIITMKQAAPEMPVRGFDLIAEIVNGFFEDDDELKAMTDQMIPLYAKYYSEEDVDALLAFYSTPTGQKVIKTMPQLLQEGMEIGWKWAQERMPELQRRIEERLIGEGLVNEL